MRQFAEEMRIGKDVCVRQPLGDMREDTEAAAILGHGEQYGAPVIKRFADELHQRIDMIGTGVAARLMAVVAVEHGEIGFEADDRIGHVYARRGVVIAGEKQRAAAFGDGKPRAARAMTAAPPDQLNAARQDGTDVRKAQPFEDDEIIEWERQLAGSFRRRNDAAGKAAGKQMHQRAGLIFMGMRQEEIAALADVIAGEMGKLVARITALIAAVHDKGYFAALHEIAVALLIAGIARQIQLHGILPVSAGLRGAVRFEDKQ